ncbi:MAG: hypothetical protein BalsKO_08330 [Balneolaceae bacterium]
MKNTFSVYFSALFFLILFNSNVVQAQSELIKKSIKAERLTTDSEIQINGQLDEEAWRSAESISGFIQNFPVDGGSPSEQTEVKILYSDKYLYVGAFAFDSSPRFYSCHTFQERWK